MLRVALAAVKQFLAERDNILARFSPTQRQRYSGFQRPQRRDQYLATQALLMSVLDLQGLKLHPGWSIVSSAGRAPRIDADRQLFASVSHCVDQVAVAVSDAPVGIDLELSDTDRDIGAMTSLYCSPTELARMDAMMAPERTGYAYQLWCLKEARLKSTEEQGGVAQMAQLSLVRTDAQSAPGLTWQRGSYLIAMWHAAGLSDFAAGPDLAACVGWRLETDLATQCNDQLNTGN